MSYLALARKWRPTKFNEVVGQAHVLTALENALAQNRLHHAYLFSGTRGVGKTTIGRLFAKGLNCETGITASPCGVCDTCKEIDEGRFVDLLEIDAASRTKVEDTRELLDNVQYKPARGRFKVYLIDEVHMLSRHSFNALLKTLEEPPEYVKFLLATTDPQKLPVTILSRCLQFHLKPISVDNIHEQLDHILQHESVNAEARALGMIAHAADGSMRDALSLSDQAIALGNGQVLTDSVAHMLGTLDTDQAIHLLEAISSKQPQTAMECIATLAQNGVEWDGLLQQLATQLHRLAMYQALPATLDQNQPDSEKVELLARALSPQDVQLYYQIALKGRQDLPLSPSERVGLEMVILRMMAFRPVSQLQANAISTQVEASAPIEPKPVNTVPVVNPALRAQPKAPIPQSQPDPSANSVPPVVDYGYEPPQYDEPPIEQYIPPSEQFVPPQPDMGQSSAQPKRQPSSQPSERTSSSLSGLRHQLRSQRKGLNPGQDNTPKKANATSAKPESVLDRVAKKHGGSAQVSPLSQPNFNAAPEPAKDEPYQWKPALPQTQKESIELTPTLLKKALEHEKTPEMVQKLVDESLEKNEWAKLISQLTTAKLTEQLALNSYYEKSGASISLTLRATQAHLNTDKAQSELLGELNRVLGEECHLSVEVGESGETPLELRDKLYQGRLKQAFTSLEQDQNVQFIEKRFAAQLDKESVRPI
ncbi:DNA polymerase III subunit gamma/tau [Vibrio europaeus]|uniref:DNA polymerase III subunit gamma/tau n=1 Tax=Vibrio europaeus TaxID=300876 RepID=A0AAE7DWQ1_9VIBR|nr:DNA polymerase III subunit gamma/tau [Vibrio europaeus]MDC5803574.1 DNA polymerase III subunit gamma/tau [Vibrio europaeus]MDC5810527.1 DNA polymerase III subunit gamma/tau [Vibrio europaeus]MDC5823446.1 DNA polymerase III subunit gamma/tau [Vibrio europaeus]MDC5828716.1 DNA polymerase III subunit gamma/tau [Vibrio europaeus]MDC5833179.1 DNA polymerase III subunit gamma/tau [Vibrio europaeus]